MISLLLLKSEAKPRMSVNNKDIIRMYLGYNCMHGLLPMQKPLPINAFFVNSKQWLQVMFTYIKASLGTNRPIIIGLISTYHSVLWLVISDMSQYKAL